MPDRIGYELLGDIAIIEFKGGRKGEVALGRELMGRNPLIKTVLAKAGPVTGKYRVRKLRHVCGRRNYLAHYRENGCSFIFDVRKTFFSSKLSFERSRILAQVREGENVMVMFSGVGPFAIEIAKARRSASVIGIEANPDSHRYMLGNIRLNKVSNVTAVKGDVKRAAKRHASFADRVIMPLPWSSLDFLGEALLVSKRKATVHIYVIGDANTVVEHAWRRIREHAKENAYAAKRLFTRVVRTYSPKEVEMVIDYTITKRGK